jgi:hypothetical protein
MAFDPYSQWLLIPAGPRPPSYYRLVRVPAEETAEDRIREAGNAQFERVRRNQLGPQRQQVAGVLSEISRGIDCLIDPQRRAEYRAVWLRDTMAYWLRADRGPADDSDKSKAAPRKTDGGGKPSPEPPIPVPRPDDVVPAVGSAWDQEGLLLRLTVYDGEVHLLVSSATSVPGGGTSPFVPPPAFPPRPLGGPPGGPAPFAPPSPTTFEAISDEADFDAQVLDYNSLRECGRADRVLVKGTVCDPTEAAYRLNDKVPLVSIKTLQKSGRPDTLVNVDGPQRTAVQPDPSLTGLSRLLRTPPAPGTEVEFTCYVQDTGLPEGTLHVSPSVGISPQGGNPVEPARVPVRLAEGRAPRSSLYRGSRMCVAARVASSGPDDLVFESGEVLPDMTREKENWRRERQDPASPRSSSLTITGLFQSRSEKFSETLQQEQACIGVRKLFGEDEALEVFYGPSALIDEFLGGLKDGTLLALGTSAAAGCIDGSVYVFKEPTRPAAAGAPAEGPPVGPPRPRRGAIDDPFGAPRP